MVGEKEGRAGSGIELLHWSIVLTRAARAMAAAL